MSALVMVAGEFLTSFPVVPSNLTKPLLVEEAGPTTSPMPATAAHDPSAFKYLILKEKVAPKVVIGAKSMRKVWGERGELEEKMSPAQREVFLVVDEWWKKYGFAPTLRDIAYVRGKMGLGNTKKIVDRLIELGALKKLDGKRRSLRPVYINFRNLD